MEKLIDFISQLPIAWYIVPGVINFVIVSMRYRYEQLAHENELKPKLSFFDLGITDGVPPFVFYAVGGFILPIVLPILIIASICYYVYKLILNLFIKVSNKLYKRSIEKLKEEKASLELFNKTKLEIEKN